MNTMCCSIFLMICSILILIYLFNYVSMLPMFAKKVDKFVEETSESLSNSALLTTDMKRTPFCNIDNHTYSSSDKEYAYCKFKSLQEKSPSQLSQDQRAQLESKEDIYTKSFRDGDSDGQLYSELFDKNASYILKNKLLTDRNNELLKELERLRRLIDSMERFSPQRADLLRTLLKEYGTFQEYAVLVEKLRQVDTIEDSINLIIKTHTERSLAYIASYIEKVYKIVQYAISIDIQAIQAGITTLGAVTFSPQDMEIVTIVNNELNSLKLYIDGILEYVRQLNLYFHLENALPSNVTNIINRSVSLNNTRVSLLKSYFEKENIQDNPQTTDVVAASATATNQVRSLDIQQPMKYPSLLKDEVRTIGMTVKPTFLQIMLYFLLTLQDTMSHRFSFEIKESISASESTKLDQMITEFQAGYMLTLQSFVVQGKKRHHPSTSAVNARPRPGMVSIAPVLGSNGST